MKEFFKKRRLNLLLLGVTVFLFFVGFFLSSGNNKDIVWGIGKPLQWSFAISSLLLFIIFFLPVKVFQIWKYLGVICFIYGFYEISKLPIFKSCFMLNCDRYAEAGFITLFLSVLSLALAILLAIIWHFWERRKGKKLINTVN